MLPNRFVARQKAPCNASTRWAYAKKDHAVEGVGSIKIIKLDQYVILSNRPVLPQNAPCNAGTRPQ
jgi:hypothetical protein